MDTAYKIIEKLEKIRDLPTLPVVAQKISEASRKANTDAQDITKIVSDDPAIMARILKVVNSPLYAGREPITSVQQAVARMGMRTISNLAVSTSVFSAFGEDQNGDFSREKFWTHSISVGIAAQVAQDIAREHLSRRIDRELLRLAGLLHDIGKILMDQHFHDEFIAAVKLAREENTVLVDAELKLLGADHSQVGAWLGIKWKLSDEVMAVIRRHHKPAEAEDQFKDIVHLCNVANFVCNKQGIGDSGETPFPRYDHESWDALGLSIDDIPRITERLEEESEKSEILTTLMSEQ